MDLTDFVLDPVTLGVLIVLIVEFVKELGVKGRALQWAALGLGFSLALAFKLGELFPQHRVWIEVFFFGLAGGLAAPGLYRVLDDRLPKNGAG